MATVAGRPGEGHAELVQRLVTGRVVPSSGSGEPLRGYRVRAQRAGETLAESVSDRAGRLQLEWNEPVEAAAVHVAAFAPSGMALGAVRLASERLARPQEVLVPTPLTVDQASRPDLQAPPPPDPVIPVAEVEHLYRAVSVAHESGQFRGPHGLLGDIGWVHHVERELEDVEDTVAGICRGEAGRVERLRGLLAAAPDRGPDEHPHEPHEGPQTQPPCRVTPRNPSALVAAAAVLEELDDEGVGWANRAAAFYLTRLGAIHHSLAAADALLAGRMSAADFASALRQSNPYPGAHDVGDSDGHSLSASVLEEQELGRGPLPLDPCTASVARCFGHLVRAARELRSARDLPVVVGSVAPTAVCSGYDGTLTLHLAAGIRSGRNGKLQGLSLWDGIQLHRLDVVGRDGDTIQVRFPDDVAPGCACVVWLPPSPSLAQRVAEAVESDPECRALLGSSSLRPAGSSCQAGVAVRDRPTVRLTANGQPGDVTVAPCGEVVLEWDIDLPQCGTTADGRGAAARLLADGKALVAEATPTGRITVRENRSVSYTLTAHAFGDDERCGEGRANVHVERRGRVSLDAPERVFYPPEPVPVTVDVDCPAAEDLTIVLASSDSSVLPGGKAVIPAGETRTTVELSPPGPFGTVTVTGSIGDAAIEYETGSIELALGETSCFEDDPSRGGRWEIARTDVTESVDLCPAGTTLQDAGASQHANAGTRLLQAGTEVRKAFGCFGAPDTTAADTARCDNWKAEQDAARGQWVETRRQECAQTRDDGYNKCTEQRDQGYSKCTEERDQGYSKCTEERDQGYSQCCTWWPCSWACSAWVWVSNIVCVAWTWVSNIVCVAWTWVSNIVCVAWTWVSNIVCVAWTWIVEKVWQAGSWVAHGACKGYAWLKNSIVGKVLCFLGHLAAAVFNFVIALVHVLLGALLKLAAIIVRGGCALVNLVLGRRGGTTTSERLKVVGIHVAVLHTGKVLIFSYDEGVQPVTRDSPADPTSVGDSNRALCALWDPATGAASYVPLNRNLFCSGHCFAPDGRLFVAGGQFPLPVLGFAPGADSDVHAFDPAAERWDRLPDMDAGRWYPTCATLPDGRAFVISGTNAWATMGGFFGGIQNSFVIVDPATRVVPASKLLIAPIAPAQVRPWKIYHLYPFVHVLPFGAVFVHYRRITRLFNPDNELWSVPLGGSGSSLYGGGVAGLMLTQHPFSRTGPGPGTSVLLPLKPDRDPESGRVRYPNGRILILGGGGAEGDPEPAEELFPTDNGFPLDPTTPATETAEILDFDDPVPAWRLTAPMRYGRVMPDSVLLPDGKVFVVNGGTTGQSGGFLSHMPGPTGIPDMGATGPVRAPEIFDPDTETWEVMCEKPFERLYHATAVLLPDARVLVAGHDGFLNMEPYVDSRYELEVYSPPYLFRGPRPVIRSAPETLRYGESFEIRIDDPRNIASVALIKQPSVTHQINTDQRYVGLAVVPPAADGRLRVDAPPDGAVAPPGFYMLFVVTRQGVPSVARWVSVGPSLASDE